MSAIVLDRVNEKNHEGKIWIIYLHHAESLTNENILISTNTWNAWIKETKRIHSIQMRVITCKGEKKTRGRDNTDAKPNNKMDCFDKYQQKEHTQNETKKIHKQLEKNSSTCENRRTGKIFLHFVNFAVVQIWKSRGHLFDETLNPASQPLFNDEQFVWFKFNNVQTVNVESKQIVWTDERG